MTRIWLVSDTHFGHGRIIQYAHRPFHHVTEMDEALVERWNSVVKPSDHVYHLGDVAMRRPALKIVERLHGHKRLIFGNHDIFDYKSYTEVGFKKLMALRVFGPVVLSHIPLHPNSIKERWLGNIHGHLHQNLVQDATGTGADRRYLNICVERTKYTPILLEDAIERLRAQRSS